MTIFIIAFLIFVLYSVFRSKGRILCNELFWLSCFWIFIIGVFFFGGVKYGGYGTSLELYIFLFTCFFAFSIGRNKGYHKVKSVNNTSVYKNRTNNLTILGIVGLCIYVFDVFRLNGILFLFDNTGTKAIIETSFLGGLGSLFIPILLVQGIYLFSKGLVFDNKINIYALLLLILYTLPCVFHTGREAILYIMIAIMASYGYKRIIEFGRLRLQKKNNNQIKKVFIVIVTILAISSLGNLIVNLSQSRFGENEINTFLKTNDVNKLAINEASNWGDFEFLYYNLLSYFSHQIPFLDFTLKEYDGPYLCGFYELNIISRRLPESLNLDYVMVFDKLEYLYSKNRISFSGGWNTVLGSFICEFGWLGTIILCFLIGYYMGKIRKKFDLTHNIRYAVIIILFCVSAFATIQLGPFFNILIYGSYIWWYILFERKPVSLKILK